MICKQNYLLSFLIVIFLVYFLLTLKTVVKGIENNIHKIIDLCKVHQVDAIYLFGSAATEHFNKNSDYDFLVQFNKSIELLNYADNYFTLLDKLKNLLKRDVDLVSERSLKNTILIKEINNTKISLYEP